MKRIHEIGTYKSGNLRLEVVDLTDLEETVNENTAVFMGHTMVTSFIEGHEFSEFYEISRAYLKHHTQWRVVASQSARLAMTPERIVNYVRGAAA
jgi:hypothetical protein